MPERRRRKIKIPLPRDPAAPSWAAVVRIFVGLGLVAMAACGSDETCKPGAVVDCHCAQGSKVEVVCGDDGVAPPCLCGSGHQRSGKLDWSANDAVVVDGTTGLMWQRKLDGQAYTWQDAKAYCVDLTLAGYDDWLLPHKDDLLGIVMTTTTAPSIDTIAFPDTPSKPFWTRTLYGPQSDTSAWGVDFKDGGQGYAVFSELHQVRCVRTATP
jgi:hypothetical protein